MKVGSSINPVPILRTPMARRTGMTREHLSAVADAVTIGTGLVLLLEALGKLIQ
jgi:hypothetical protein